MKKPRKYRNAAECAAAAADMRLQLAQIPSDCVELAHRIGAAIDRFAEMGDRPYADEGQAEVPDLGCHCEWSFSTQRIKRPVLRLVRSPHLRSLGMSQRELDAVLRHPVRPVQPGESAALITELAAAAGTDAGGAAP